MHFEALLVLTFGFAAFATLASFVLLFAALDSAEAESDLLEQFLLVQWLFMTIDPQVQNSAKRITPYIKCATLAQGEVHMHFHLLPMQMSAPFIYYIIKIGILII